MSTRAVLVLVLVQFDMKCVLNSFCACSTLRRLRCAAKYSLVQQQGSQTGNGKIRESNQCKKSHSTRKRRNRFVNELFAKRATFIGFFVFQESTRLIFSTSQQQWESVPPTRCSGVHMNIPPFSALLFNIAATLLLKEVMQFFL